MYLNLATQLTRCTHVCDLHIQKDAEYITQDTPTHLKANLGWSFFSLIKDPHFDLKKHFVDETLITRGDYILPEPDSEEQRMEKLLKAIMIYYELGKESSQFEVNLFPSSKGNQNTIVNTRVVGTYLLPRKKKVQRCPL